MKITVIGLGYVGLSNALLLSFHHDVWGLDISEERVATLQAGKSPLVDREIEAAMADSSKSFQVTMDFAAAIADASYVIIATPTNYDEVRNQFDTSAVDSVLQQLVDAEYKGAVIIKSTIPIGFTADARKRFPALSISFSPEFLREGKALYDNQHPSRVVVSDEVPEGPAFAEILAGAALDENVSILTAPCTECEAIKLFANTYLAMRVAYFNELDSFAMSKGLSTKKIIEGVSLDPRIGNHYNNPSFGYGGYCLPKDSKELLANFEGVPQALISAIVESNDIRKQFITDSVIAEHPTTVGVYRLAMKSGSDNARSSAILDIIGRLTKQGISVIVYDQGVKRELHKDLTYVDDFAAFAQDSDLILANRMDSELKPYASKVRTRDLFERD